MISHRRALSVALLLALLGVLGILVRIETTPAVSYLSREQVWRLECDIRFAAERAGARVSFALAENTPTCRVSREEFLHPSLVVDVVRNHRTGGRSAVAVAPAPMEDGRFQAGLDVRVVPSAEAAAPAPAALTAADLDYYLRDEPSIQVNAPVAARQLAALGADGKTKEKLLDDIFEHVAEDIAGAGEEGGRDAASALEDGSAAPVGRARAMVALCRAGKIPARLVAGLRLVEPGEVRTHVWVEAYRRGGWVPYDPVYGYAGELPPYYLPMDRDSVRIVTTRGARIVAETFLLTRTPESWLIRGSREGGVVRIVDLTRLSPGIQKTLTVLLLLPLAALVTAVFRNLVGVETYGTFTPGLLALSFLYADVRTGALVFVCVLGIGLAGRVALGFLKLLMVPRVGGILTLVVLMLVMAVSVFDYLGWTPSARAVLLPMVILTMLIERFHIRAEEDGVRSSLLLLAGTLGVALACYLVLQIRILGQLALAFPEGLLGVAAALVLIGRYTGYRLTELWRFRDFRETPAAPPPPAPDGGEAAP